VSLWRRFLALLGMKASRGMDALEKPAEVLDYAYEDQQRLLMNFRRSLADVATAKALVAQQVARVRENVAKLDKQARDAVAQGRDDLATEAIKRKLVTEQQATQIEQQLHSLEAQEQELVDQEAALQMRIENFRAAKEVTKAKYVTAEARVKIGESMTGLSQSAYDTGAAIARMEDKTQQMTARVEAIGELSEAGVLNDYSGDDHLARELAQVTQSGAVADELARLKVEAAPAKAAIGSGE
jgi:phage shock protein A